MDLSDYQKRVADALSGLVPICWLERTMKCADRRNPTIAEMFPTPEEREAMLEKIVMADGLACGAPSKSQGALAAVAKALACLSLAPGGVVFLGRRWRTVEGGGEKPRCFLLESNEKDVMVFKTKEGDIVCVKCAGEGAKNFPQNELALACDRCGQVLQ